MATWKDAVELCKEWHKKSCYDCPISKECIDRGGHKSKQDWEESVLKATEVLKKREK